MAWEIPQSPKGDQGGLLVGRGNMPAEMEKSEAEAPEPEHLYIWDVHRRQLPHQIAKTSKSDNVNW